MSRQDIHSIFGINLFEGLGVYLGFVVFLFPHIEGKVRKLGESSVVLGGGKGTS